MWTRLRNPIERRKEEDIGTIKEKLRNMEHRSRHTIRKWKKKKPEIFEAITKIKFPQSKRNDSLRTKDPTGGQHERIRKRHIFSGENINRKKNK